MTENFGLFILPGIMLDLSIQMGLANVLCHNGMIAN